MARRKFLQRIGRYFQPYWPLAGMSIAAHGAFEILDLLVPYAIGQILNVLSGQPLDAVTGAVVRPLALSLGNYGLGERPLALMILMGFIFLIAVVRAPIQPWISAWFHWLIPLQARRDRQAGAIAKILTLPLEFYDTHNPGRIANRINRGLENHTWSYPEVAGQLMPKLARVGGIFMIMVVIDWRVAVPFLLSFTTVMALALRDLSKIIRKEQRIDHHMENTASRTSELVTNIKTVKAFATEYREYERQRQRLNRETFAIIRGIHRDYVILNTWQRTAIQSASFGVLTIALWAAYVGQISLGHFVTLMTIANMGYAELEPISQIAELLARRYSPIQRFHEFMEEDAGLDSQALSWANSLQAPSSTPDSDPSQRPLQFAGDSAIAYQFKGEIEFQNVSFSYDGQRPILKDFSLLIKPYETIALVGRSGSGKSTLVKLLFRYFEPDGGRILIDGQDIKTLDATAYRRRLAIVHQEVDVFNGTLLSNLRYGNPEATQREVEQACAIARVDEFVQTLPQGYQTVVGERGLRLSGGQRQRLGIARALLVNPDVLIFDEATSSLDSESERSIQIAMQTVLGTRTTLAIAHRLSTIREADRIVVLDGGEIAEVGTHQALIEQGGLYQRLHSLQESGEFY
ncbi:MAG: ABC transporter ATP-binding protein/permease [Cyanobacteria bacterium]|nr:ABC transporter ATP-binding protein/permease [Cyanobacteriota bacterium]